MTEDLYNEQVRLEEEARGATIERYLKQNALDQDTSDADIGLYLIRNLINPFAKAIQIFIDEDAEAVASQKAKKHKISAKLLKELDPAVSAFLFIKAVLGGRALDKSEHIRASSLAVAAGNNLAWEISLQRFKKENHNWMDKIVRDFNKRDISQDDREALMKRVFAKHDLDYEVWSPQEKYHVGYALIDLFIQTTGMLELHRVYKDKQTNEYVSPSDLLMETIAARTDAFAPLMSLYPPMIVKPRPWSPETLEWGGYISDNLTPYPLVKRSRRPYRRMLKQKAQAGEIDIVTDSINALQETPWKVNTQVLEVLDYAFHANLDVKKLPPADKKVPEDAPDHVKVLPWEHEEQKKYRAYCFKIHEYNRTITGARAMAIRTINLARKYSKYDRIYFPHDLDSRGRAYPKPVGLNPQGTDYVKGLLQFADGKPLGQSGLYWLGVHGANSYGEDKLPIAERAGWAERNLDLARAVAEDPKACLEWTKADAPFQFLAWCFEWSAAHELSDPTEFVSHLHVDLDATCSGLQHFSAMLRDEVGGRYVNMVPSKVREDVYLAVADLVKKQVEQDTRDPKKPSSLILSSIGVDRSITKRSVMVQPYAGTRQSCYEYVSEALKEKLGGRDLTKDEWKELRNYASDLVWGTIPEVVIAADGAMKWLKAVSRLVGKSQGDQMRLEWTTPVGLPVWQTKKCTKKRQVKTVLQGSIVRPVIHDEIEKMDPRKMASSIPPSLVHSLDAAHLQLTIFMASKVGIHHFAAVHDSFGVHAADVSLFSEIIRHAFVDMYEAYDPLEEFLSANRDFITDEFADDIPELPELGALDLKGILENEFFFS